MYLAQLGFTTLVCRAINRNSFILEDLYWIRFAREPTRLVRWLMAFVLFAAKQTYIIQQIFNPNNSVIMETDCRPDIEEKKKPLSRIFRVKCFSMISTTRTFYSVEQKFLSVLPRFLP